MILRKLIIFLRHFYASSLKLQVLMHAVAKASAYKTGCSAARLAHLVWDQRVAGSNPATPTKEKALPRKRQDFVLMSVESLLS